MMQNMRQLAQSLFGRCRCHAATNRNTLQHPATHCNKLQHTATYYNTLQHTASAAVQTQAAGTKQTSVLSRCNTLQHTATHCNTLQHIATHCNTLLPQFYDANFEAAGAKPTWALSRMKCE